MLVIILTIIFFLIDIFSKYLITRLMLFGESITIIDNFLNITYVKNTGAAWSILNNNTLIVTIISIIIISFLIWYIYINSKNNNKFEKIGYALVLGGALGNLFDRLVYGYVIDFIDIYIFNYDYPIFNLADTFIVIGVIILFISMWRDKKDGV